MKPDEIRDLIAKTYTNMTGSERALWEIALQLALLTHWGVFTHRDDVDPR